MTVERRAEREAMLERLLIKLGAARGDGAAEDDARAALEAFAGTAIFSDLEERARAARDASINDALEAFTDHLTAAQTKLDTATQLVSQAEQLAEEGKKSLIVPWLAAKTTKLKELADAIAQSIETIQDGLGGLDAAFDEGDVDGIQTSLEGIVDSVTGAKDRLDELVA